MELEGAGERSEERIEQVSCAAGLKIRWGTGAARAWDDSVRSRSLSSGSPVQRYDRGVSGLSARGAHLIRDATPNSPRPISRLIAAR